MGKLINEVGNKYGRLTVLERSGSNKRGEVMWLCECECDKKFIVRGANLRNGHTRSCGCSWQGRPSLLKGEASFNQVLGNIKRAAKRRKYDWQLTKAQFRTLTQQSCYYCDAKPNQGNYSSTCNGRYLYNGLDRVDNEQGYVIGNVVPCCGKCNRAKDTMTTEQFRVWLCKAYEHFVK